MGESIEVPLAPGSHTVVAVHMNELSEPLCVHIDKGGRVDVLVEAAKGISAFGRARGPRLSEVPRTIGDYGSEPVRLSKSQAWTIAVIASLGAPAFLYYVTESLAISLGLWTLMILTLSYLYAAAVKQFSARAVGIGLLFTFVISIMAGWIAYLTLR
jgi:hypothetical protein